MPIFQPTSFFYGGQEISLVKSDHLAALLVKTQDTRRTTTRGIGGGLPISGKTLGNFQIVTMPKTRSLPSENRDGLDELREQDEVIVGSHVYHLLSDKNAVPIVPSGKLYIEFMSDSGQDQQQTLLAEHDLQVERNIGNNAYIVAISPRSPNPIKVAVMLQKSEQVLIAEPDLIMPVATCALPMNKLLTEQWHLRNTGEATLAYGKATFKKGADAKVRDAWEHIGHAGKKEVVIAIVDTGFDLEHPDLKGNGQKIKAPIDLETGTSNVYPSAGSAHGTGCAGVALGAGTPSGIAGACPNASFVPIKMPYLSDLIIEKMVNHALQNGVDILSCSLGFPSPTPLSVFQQNSLSRLAREGRNGKGCIMLFATGNSYRELSDFATHPEVFAITASNSLDEFSDYSNYGSNVLLCAPSDGNSGAKITTSDLVGPAGDTPRNYVADFGGTSSATPLAAGICGLLLSVNPNLKAGDVKRILKETSEKIAVRGGYDNKGHSIYTGYGKINALAAIKKLMQSGINPQLTDDDLLEIPVNDDKAAIVTAFQLNVRSKPNRDSEIIDVLDKDDIVNIEASIGVWCKIGNGRYVNGTYLKILRKAKRGIVTASKLNVRADHNTDSSILEQLTARTEVDILETVEGWYRIGDFKWVSAKHVRIIA